MSWAIQVEGLSKSFRLGRGHGPKFDNFHQVVTDTLLAAAENLVIELHDQTCHEVFFRAIQGLPLDVTRSGELTVCRRKQGPAMQRAA